ncbi:MAG: NFYB/HAP3 family transcription factor subunit [Candidatus Woesearchaeota archaeon]|jgi:histone H3/H4|nr:NFYB/HAP3 family transcription factor subunit [Candidatus Woesearchaeota archaeon]
MAKRENILPFAPIGKLIQDSTGKRVSKDAKETAAQILEEVTEKIIKKAALITEHSKRKTVKSKDINLAYNQVKGEL